MQHWLPSNRNSFQHLGGPQEGLNARRYVVDRSELVNGLLKLVQVRTKC